jgi:hypothetical protein
MKNLCIVVLRILGIYCLIEAFVLMQGLYYVLTMSEEFSKDIGKMIFASLLPSIVLLCIGVLLIVFSRKLANIITPISEVAQENTKYSLQDIQSILFSVVGVLIFALAIPRTFTWISQLISLIMNDSQGLRYGPKAIRETWISLILSIFQFSIGIGLFFGAKKLSLFWHRVREYSPNKEIDKRT